MFVLCGVWGGKVYHLFVSGVGFVCVLCVCVLECGVWSVERGLLATSGVAHSIDRSIHGHVPTSQPFRGQRQAGR